MTLSRNRAPTAFGKTSMWTGILASIALLNGAGSSVPSQLERVDPGTEVPSISVEELVRAIDDGRCVPRVIDVHLREDFDSDSVFFLPRVQFRYQQRKFLGTITR